MSKKFNPKKLQKLNNPERLKDIPPYVIRDIVGLGSVDVIVDIGAGTGFFSVALLKEFSCQRIYACDLSDDMINWMRENLSEKYPEIIPLKSDETKVPLDSEIADVVVMINLHHELENPDSILKESFRLLRPGGKILIVDWKKEEMDEGPPYEVRCEVDDVAKQLTLAGFENVEIYNTLRKHFIVAGIKAPAIC